MYASGWVPRGTCGVLVPSGPLAPPPPHAAPPAPARKVKSAATRALLANFIFEPPSLAIIQATSALTLGDPTTWVKPSTPRPLPNTLKFPTHPSPSFPTD